MKVTLQWISGVQIFVANQKEELYILSQNKVGFSINGVWYVFPEQAIYLLQLSMCKIMSGNDQLSLNKVYQMIYDHPEDQYNRFHINYFYHYLRKQGCFPIRYNLSYKIKQISTMLGLPQKVHSSIKQSKYPAYQIYKQVSDYTQKINSQLCLVVLPQNFVDLEVIKNIQNLKKIAIVQNADLNILSIENMN